MQKKTRAFLHHANKSPHEEGGGVASDQWNRLACSGGMMIGGRRRERERDRGARSFRSTDGGSAPKSGQRMKNKNGAAGAAAWGCGYWAWEFGGNVWSQREETRRGELVLRRAPPVEGVHKSFDGCVFLCARTKANAVGARKSY